MDNAIIGFNRHANLVERYRVAVLRYRGLKSAYETGVKEREEWREARLAAATRRTLLRAMICDYVHRLRDEGVGPERVLIAVKGRMVLAVTKTAPAAPDMEADALMHDASDWVISAYYEAA
ncbi:MAG: hypothetical protein ABIY52_04670 [Gemmatimonadaceae bacterium]